MYLKRESNSDSLTTKTRLRLTVRIRFKSTALVIYKYIYAYMYIHVCAVYGCIHLLIKRESEPRQFDNRNAAALALNDLI